MAEIANNDIFSANATTLVTDFNVTPYYDDYDRQKEFYRVLFKPGYAVQSRELTQVQSILQDQIFRFGKHVFKEGDIVLPGRFTFKMGSTTNSSTQGIYFVKIKNVDINNDVVDVNKFVGETLTGSTSGISARIEKVLDSDGTTSNTKTLYFSTYLNASPNDPTIRVFQPGETLTNANVGTSIVLDNDPVANTGYSSLFEISGGVLFAKNHFITFPTQSIIIDRYNSRPTCKVGFFITEEIVTSATDSSLLDPAQEASNFSAPGADRLKLTASLMVRPFAEDANIPNFVTLFTVENGVVRISNEKTQYNILGDSLARRTYEESGDYIIRGYNVTVQEHDRITGSIPNYGRYDNGDNSKLVVGVDAGNGYCKGYPISNLSKFEIDIDKPRNYKNVRSQIASTTQGQYVFVHETVGTWELDKGNRINLYDSVQKRITNFGVSTNQKWSTGAQTGNNIGSAIVNSFEYISGTPGYDAVYAAYLSDIKMEGSNTFSNVRSIYYNVASVSDPGADILGADNTSSNTTLQSINQATLLYYTGANYVKSVRDKDGAAATTYYFKKTSGVSSGLSLQTSGTVTLSLVGPSNEVFPYTVGQQLGTTDIAEDITLSFNTSINIGPLWGGAVVSGTAGARTITGVGTVFNSLNIGDKIEIEGFSNTWYVAGIANNTSLTVSEDLPTGINGTQKLFKAYKNGDIINLNGKGVDNGQVRTVTMGVSNTSMTIDLKEIFPSTPSISVSYKVAIKNTSEATKTLRPDRFVIINCATAGTTGPFCLGFSDVYRVKKIVRKAGSAPTSLLDGDNVTSFFILDNGQRDTHYELASIVKNGITLGATDRLLVQLDYFEPNYSGKGGYFSIDSYPIQDDDALSTSSTIRTENVPIFVSPVSQAKYDLRNNIDFRPVKTITAADATSVASATTNPSNNSTTYIFSGSGMKFPVPSTELLFDYSYYLGRKDIVIVNKDNTISVIPGTPSENPVIPDPLETQMIISVLDIPPYPSLSPAYGNVLKRKDLACGAKKVSNRGYTMRDIGILEKRIQNLEYYTSLTLLEKDALSFKILDDNGNDRFKNGYFIDTFKDASLSAKGIDPDFRVVFDPVELSIRPLFTTESFYYEVVSGSNISVNDNKVTMSYGEELFFQQPRVTDTRNLERGTYYFQGQMTLFPERDVWIDTTFAPDEVVSIKTDNSLISVQTSTTADVAASVNKSFLNTDWEGWKATITGYNLYRGEGASKVFVGRFDTEQAARAQAAQWTTAPKVFQPQEQNLPNWFGGVFRWTPPAQLVRGDPATLETIYNNTRLGTNWFANQSTDSAAGGNKLISSEKIPYIRPQEIYVKVQALKPYSKVNAFFDEINVSSYCTPLTESQFNLAIARQPLPLGSVAAQGSDLIVNDDGNLYFIFKIPSGDPKFKVGDRRLVVLDGEQLAPQSLKEEEDASTLASAYFFADGTKQTLQRTVYSTSGYKKTAEATSESYQSTAALVLPNTWTPPPPPKGHCCFDPNAKVLMADLTYKAIKDIQVGEKVMGDNGVINTVTKNKTINVGTRGMLKFKGSNFYTTDDHLFLTKSGWKTWKPEVVFADKNTTNGNFLIGENRERSIDDNDSLKFVEIVDGKLIEKFVEYKELEATNVDFDPDFIVHDLSLDGNKTYIVEGFVVHNCCIAYTVLVQIPADEEGIFVTSFDVFIQRKSATRPIWFELREMDSAGNVTDVTIPGSVVRVENQNIPISSNGRNNPLNVKFNAPIFLFNNKPYAFVVHSYSPGNMTVDPDTSIWISRLGERDKNTNEIVNERQRMGKTLQTTNNKQWYEIEDIDLTMNVYRAKFTKGQGTVVIGQQPVEKFFLSNVSSSLNDRIGDHFVSGDIITITPANGAPNTISVGDQVVGNISGGLASGNVVVSLGVNKFVLSNTRYVVGEKISVFNSNGVFKGITANVVSIANSSAQLSYYDESSENVYAEFISSTGGFNVGSVIQSTRNSGYDYRAKVMTVGDYRYSSVSFEPNVLDFVKTNLSYEMQTYANGSTSASAYEAIIPSETHYFPEEKVVYSKTNELAKISGDRSNKVRVTFENNSEYVSPLIDLNSTHTIFIDNIISSNSFAEGANVSAGILAKSGGFAINKYISQTISLADGQDAEDISIFLTAYRPPTTDVKLYIKILNANDPETFAQKSWIELQKLGNGNDTYSSLANRYNFRDFQFGFSRDMMTGPIGEVQYTSGNTVFTGYKYFAIKIVLTAENSAIVPRVADLRCIALQI